jgi:hypothetical protein
MALVNVDSTRVSAQPLTTTNDSLTQPVHQQSIPISRNTLQPLSDLPQSIRFISCQINPVLCTKILPGTRLLSASWRAMLRQSTSHKLSITLSSMSGLTLLIIYVASIRSKKSGSSVCIVQKPWIYLPLQQASVNKATARGSDLSLGGKCVEYLTLY